MILGISTDAFLTFHVIISLIGIASGLVVLYGLVNGQALGAWTAVFLATTILTSATGFPLPPFGFDPPRAVGILSLVLLVLAVVAFYAFELAAAWRWVYVVTAMIALSISMFSWRSFRLLGSCRSCIRWRRRNRSPRLSLHSLWCWRRLSRSDSWRCADFIRP